MSPRKAALCRFIDHEVGTGRSTIIWARTGAVIGGRPSIACWAASLPWASYFRVATGVYAKPFRVMRGRPFATGSPPITIVTAPAMLGSMSRAAVDSVVGAHIVVPLRQQFSGRGSGFKSDSYANLT